MGVVLPAAVPAAVQPQVLALHQAVQAVAQAHLKHRLAVQVAVAFILVRLAVAHQVAVVQMDTQAHQVQLIHPAVVLPMTPEHL